jgi:hypothetical protein
MIKKDDFWGYARGYCAQQTGVHKMDGSNCFIVYLPEEKRTSMYALRAQQTGMHILVVKALLVATFLSEGVNTYRHKKTLSVSYLSRAI